MTKVSEMTLEDRIEKELKDLTLPIKPNIQHKTGNLLVVVGLPLVPLSKVDQLKKFTKNKIKCEEIEMPLDSNNQTKGIIFARYTTNELASIAQKQNNGVAFDKSHTMLTVLLDDCPQLLKEIDEWKAPEPMIWRYMNDMTSWLLQRQCRDQLLVHNRSDISIYEHTSKNLEPKWSRSDFTESVVRWSPLGTYMATIHNMGVVIWGGEKFERINRFVHQKVSHISFSPNEKYLMSYSVTQPSYIVNVFDVLTAALIREFIIPKSDDDESQYWPEFRWSYDDTYFARKQKDKISVYQSDNCVMIDKKSIDIIGVKDFSWSSRGHLIAYWVVEQESSPARIVLISIPSKKEVFTKTLFNVADITLKWSSQDDFLSVVGERYIKKKIVENQIKFIGTNASLEIYRVKEKEIPVEKIVIADKVQIIASDWEPNGSKIAILTSNTSKSLTSILIYDLKLIGQTQKVMEYAFVSRTTILKWSPGGQFIACSTPNSSSIEFLDGHEGVVLKRMETNNIGEIVWDPTGRYLMSYRLNLINDINECGVSFHSITGKILLEQSFVGLKQIMWRPRPPCLLNEQEIKNIKKNMGKYYQQFAHQDEMMSNERKRKLMESRQHLMQEWVSVKMRLDRQFTSEKASRMELRKSIDTDNLEHGKCKEQTYVLVSSRMERVSH